jgi:hypothetical protein
MVFVGSADLGEITEEAEEAGYAPHTVDILRSMYFTIVSGDVELPWPQEIVENVLANYDVLSMIDLLMEHPEFIQVAVDYHNFHG